MARENPLPDRPGLPPMLALPATATAKELRRQLEFPFFSPTQKPVGHHRLYEDGKGNRIEMVGFPDLGLPTIHDQDVLIYCASALMAEINAGRMPGPRFRIESADLLGYAKRGLGGRSYDALETAIRRIAGTRLRTTIDSEDFEADHFFGMMDRATIWRRKDTPGGAFLGCEFVLSDWMMSALREKAVLTLHPDYFRLRALDRALYQLARRHADPRGSGREFRIGLARVRRKLGSAASPRRFRKMLRDALDRHTYWFAHCDENIARWDEAMLAYRHFDLHSRPARPPVLPVGVGGEVLTSRPIEFPEYDLSVEALSAERRRHPRCRYPEEDEWQLIVRVRAPPAASDPSARTPWRDPLAVAEEFRNRWPGADMGASAAKWEEVSKAKGLWPLRNPDRAFLAFVEASPCVPDAGEADIGSPKPERTSAHPAWTPAREELRRRLGPDNFRNWVERFHLVRVEGDTAFFAAETVFVGDWVRQNFGEDVLAALRTVPGTEGVARMEFESSTKR